MVPCDQALQERAIVKLVAKQWRGHILVVKIIAILGLGIINETCNLPLHLRVVINLLN